MKVDVVVIGAGPGGYVCAIRLAQHGKKVIIVEKHKLGGECLNYGCIPSKALIFASSLYERIKQAEVFGIEVKGVSFNMSKLQAFREGLVKKLTGGVSFLLKQNKVQLVSGEAKFVAPRTITVGKDKIEADYFVVATGSGPIEIPGFKYDGKTIIGSKEALELGKIPKAIVILGGGVIGLELGTYFSKLGTKVTVLEMMSQVLPGVSADLVSVVTRSLKKRGVEIITGAKASKVKKGSGVEVTYEVGGKTHTVKGDNLLVTIGRKANTGSLGLEKAGVDIDKKGFVKVDNYCKSSVDHIYAIGDVTGPPLLAHKASNDGLRVADFISTWKKTDKRPMVGAIFTDPEIATAGMTEAEARALGDAKVGKFPFQALGRSLASDEAEGFVKVISNRHSDKVLGVEIVGAHASDMISEASLAIAKGLTVEDIATTIHPHPTLPEGLMEAAESVHKKAIHIFSR